MRSVSPRPGRGADFDPEARFGQRAAAGWQFVRARTELPRVKAFFELPSVYVESAADHLLHRVHQG